MTSKRIRNYVRPQVKQRRRQIRRLMLEGKTPAETEQALDLRRSQYTHHARIIRHDLRTAIPDIASAQASELALTNWLSSLAWELYHNLDDAQPPLKLGDQLALLKFIQSCSDRRIKLLGLDGLQTDPFGGQPQEIDLVWR